MTKKAKPTKAPRKARTAKPKVRKKGIRMVLGSLEADVMESLWRQSPASVREVKDRLARKRPLAYTTVMTVMSRLEKKGYLRREQAGRAYVYSPALTYEEFRSRTITSVCTDLLGGFGEPVLSHFIATVGKLDADDLDELARLIEVEKERAAKSAT
jgi:predicted transcriptional regulator